MIRKKLTVACLLIGLAPFASSQEEPKPSYTHITNVVIFDGVNEKTTEGSVLIENNRIKAVGADVNAPDVCRYFQRITRDNEKVGVPTWRQTSDSIGDTQNLGGPTGDRLERAPGLEPGAASSDRRQS